MHAYSVFIQNSRFSEQSKLYECQARSNSLPFFLKRLFFDIPILIASSLSLDLDEALNRVFLSQLSFLYRTALAYTKFTNTLAHSIGLRTTQCDSNIF